MGVGTAKTDKTKKEKTDKTKKEKTDKTKKDKKDKKDKKESSEDTDKTKKEENGETGSSAYNPFLDPVPPGKGQKDIDLTGDSKASKQAKLILGFMRTQQPFHEMDRWFALADAGLAADYWIE